MGMGWSIVLVVLLRVGCWLLASMLPGYGCCRRLRVCCCAAREYHNKAPQRTEYTCTGIFNMHTISSIYRTLYLLEYVRKQ